MGKRIERDPEREARWAEARRRVQDIIEHNDRVIRTQRARDERRRERLRRFTFGLLPR